MTLPPDLDVPGAVLRKAVQDAKLPDGARFGIDVRSANHALGPDDDTVFAILAGQIASPGNPFVGNELEFWVGGVAGLHAPTPEPGVLLLWGTTALGLGAVARRRRRARSAISA